ncbi:rab GTPase-activating protein 1-like isoform X2 [Thalassophryne amazonica]|uniref:rab GTPase-activating protein 1-like isoform X2 n=1 Tax=Thalassophryne amazonica TaxID=390379 RepID=UPI001470BF77|nr:rab GTPase-activating protein 1-like isoform X2 [Thalassophryne amazonica]
MMEEMPIQMACSNHMLEQMSEEEILACLVADTEPTFPNLNRQLQQTSLRLEQENDSLAHKLITSKIDLRNALDKADDKVEVLTKNLQLTKNQLQAAEAERREKEEECAVLKEMFRRDLEKAQEEAKRSSCIIADYKQICSQMRNRLEKQEATHKEELETLKSAIESCSRCRHIIEPEGLSAINYEGRSVGTAPEDSFGTADPGQDDDTAGLRVADQRKKNQEWESLSAQIRELEQELAQTKLQMVEAKCHIQELEHQKGLLTTELDTAKSRWFNKAFTSLRPPIRPLPSTPTRRARPPALNWNLHSKPLSEWTSKKLSWPHRDNNGSVS